MYCRYCGEDNPEEAVFCKNCGKKLKEEIKKPEVIETPKTEHEQTTQSTTTTSSTSSDNSDWIGCCLCLIGSFIFFSIMGALGF